MDSLTSCSTSAHKCFFTTHVSPFMTWGHLCFSVPLESYVTVKCFANVFPFPFLSNVKQYRILLTALMLHLQTCMDKHQVVGVLRQMEKFLKGQEMRFTEGLRIMKSKLATLQNSVSKMPQADQSAGKWTFNFITVTIKWPTAKLLIGLWGKNKVCFAWNLWLPDSCSKQRRVMSLAFRASIFFVDVHWCLSVHFSSTGTATFLSHHANGQCS